MLLGSSSLSCIRVEGQLRLMSNLGHRRQGLSSRCMQKLTGTFLWVTRQTLSLPLTAMLVKPTDLTALKAYSAVPSRIRSCSEAAASLM